MRVSRDEFEKLVSKTLEGLPKRFRESLENIVIVVEDSPSGEVLHELGLRAPQRLLGLYRGVPLKHRGIRYGNVLPDRIVIYQKPIEAMARSRGELLRQIRLTVMHEVGHFFGLGESDLREIEGGD
jgi:predicted Zn-dependent protease with MMP-like domain